MNGGGNLVGEIAVGVNTVGVREGVDTEGRVHLRQFQELLELGVNTVGKIVGVDTVGVLLA